ncbi:MAG: hypothetical protein HQK65_20700 [Desulfamplus sp.]|nr:hypothetical protein [Desulfamplus sp.]
MKTMFKIALIFSFIVCTSFAAQAAAVTATQTAAGGEVALVGTDGTLTFTPSGSTQMGAVTNTDTYAIVACSSRDSNEIMSYGMVESSNGYYQTKTGTQTLAQVKANAVSATITAWTSMGGGS